MLFRSSLWALLAAPLLAGNDLSNMSQETVSLLTNREVIAVDQDPAGIQGRRVWQEGPLEVWVKPLADGSRAVGLFNRNENAGDITVRFADAWLPGRVTGRDLWQHKDLGVFNDSFTARVPRHGVVLLRMK